jgi:hypothetical protein
MTLSMAMSASMAMTSAMAATSKSYFTAEITFPGGVKAEYNSSNYSYSKPLDVSDLKATTSKVTFKLTKVVKNGKTQSLSNYHLCYDYKDTDSHIDSLKVSGRTLKLPLSFIKASAYTKKNSIARLVVRDNNGLPTDKVSASAILPIGERSYKKNVSKTLDFVYLKNGQYGTKTKGLFLYSDNTLVNNKSIVKKNYAWWTSEYEYINKKWRAVSFDLSLNYPFKYQKSKKYSAYKMSVNRDSNGYIKSMSLDTVLVYKGTNKYGEYWSQSALSKRDSRSATMTKNWAIGDTFKYSLSAPRLKELNAYAHTMNVTWQDVHDCNGFEVAFAKSKNFTNAKKATVNNGTATKVVLNSLMSNTQYYVRVRAYGREDGHQYYSKWSNVLTVKTKAE